MPQEVLDQVLRPWSPGADPPLRPRRGYRLRLRDQATGQIIQDEQFQTKEEFSAALAAAEDGDLDYIATSPNGTMSRVQLSPEGLAIWDRLTNSRRQ
jgi:hypothetical protein